MEYEDPTIAKEMVRLLGQELKQVRNQLREAKEANSIKSEGSALPSSMKRLHAVEAENADLRARIKILEQDVADGVSTHNSSNIADISDQLLDRDKLLNEKDENISCLQEKMKSYKEKIRAKRSNITALQKELDEAQQQIKQLEHERDKAENRASNNEQEKQRFDYQKFLVSAPRMARPSEIKHRPPFPIIGEDTKLTLSMSGLDTARFSENEILWSSDNISRAIAIRPFHRYHSDGPGSEWEHSFTPQPFTAKNKYVLFYRHDGWAYVGNFECVQAIPLDLDQYKTLPLHMRKYATTRTILTRDHVSKSISGLVDGMYAQGILKVECLAFKFLSFDINLNKKLLSDMGILTPSQGSVIHVPGTGSQSKRGADDDDSHQKYYPKKARVGR